MLRQAAAILAALLSAAPLAASAATYTFSYSGVDQDDSFVTASGSGTISFSGTGALTLADLDAFSFAQTTTLSDPALLGSGRFSYGLADVTSFTATYTSGTLSALTLLTRTVADPTGFLADESFRVRSLAVNGARTAFDDAGTDTATTGTVRFTAAAVPEPATWAMMIVGVGGVGGTMRRQRARRRVDQGGAAADCTA